jgi:plasmid stability protein
LRAALFYVKTRNITLTLPETLIKKLKIKAAKEDTSVSALLREQCEKLLRNDGEPTYEQAMKESIASMQRGYEFGTNDKIKWTREELQERR